MTKLKNMRIQKKMLLREIAAVVNTTPQTVQQMEKRGIWKPKCQRQEKTVRTRYVRRWQNRRANSRQRDSIRTGSDWQRFRPSLSAATENSRKSGAGRR